MKKKILYAAAALLLVLAAGAWVAWSRMGEIVKAAVETVGPKAVRADVRVARVLLSPLTGRARVRGLFVGNPAGFKSESAVRVRDARVAVDLKSLRTDFVRVREIVVDGPEITLEMGLKGSNLARLQKNAESFVPAAPPAGGKAAPAKPVKLVIGLFRVTNGKVRFSAAGQGLTVPLPDIELRGIGEKKGGATVSEAVSAMLGAVTSAALKAAGGAANLAKGGLRAVEGVGKGVAGAAGGGAKALKGLFGKKKKR